MKNKSFYFWAIVYKIVLEVVYAKIVAPVYSAYYLFWNPDWKYFLLTNAMFVTLLIILPKEQDKPSKQLVQLFFFTTIVPLLSFSWVTSQGINYLFLVFVCSLILFFMIRTSKTLVVPLLEFESKMKPIKFVNLIFGISLILTVLFAVRFGGIDFRAFSFDTVYDLRAEQKSSGIWAYLLNWATKLFIPFCIIVYLTENRKKLFVTSSLMQVFFYLSTGHKTTLFSVFFLVGCTYLLKKDMWKTGIPKMYSLIIGISTLIYLVTDYLMSIAIFPVRQLIVPAQISIAHYQFFAINPKLYFSEGLIGKIFNLESPYAVHSTFLFSADGSSNWNTGFLADAYDNGGFITMIAYTLILGMIFLFVDAISRNKVDRYKYTALIAYSIIILNDGSLLTTLFTWGLGLLLVILYINASQERQLEKSKIPLES